jgi:hypothetical protein
VERKTFILLGYFSVADGLTAAQTLAPQIIAAEEHDAPPVLTLLPTLSTASPGASFLLPQGPISI